MAQYGPADIALAEIASSVSRQRELESQMAAPNAPYLRRASYPGNPRLTRPSIGNVTDMYSATPRAIIVPSIPSANDMLGKYYNGYQRRGPDPQLMALANTMIHGFLAAASRRGGAGGGGGGGGAGKPNTPKAPPYTTPPVREHNVPDANGYYPLGLGKYGNLRADESMGKVRPELDEQPKTPEATDPASSVQAPATPSQTPVQVKVRDMYDGWLPLSPRRSRIYDDAYEAAAQKLLGRSSSWFDSPATKERIKQEALRILEAQMSGAH